MPPSRLRIVTRESPLAMWQARHVRESLLLFHPDLEVELIGVKTEADQFLDRTLASMGGKGAFIKELEAVLLAGRADLAVHSMKDVTVELPEELELPVILKREAPGDAFVSNHYGSLDDLPVGAVVGTSSPRRRCQVKHYRPDLQVDDIRGNVGTRLKKLDQGRYHALILATAGLQRLQLEQRITRHLPATQILPAIGQGALGIEIRRGDTEVLSLLRELDDADSHACVAAERAVSRRLDCGCLAPLAGYAVIEQGELRLSALIGRPDGSRLMRAETRGRVAEAEALGDAVGRDLLEQGAGAILEEIRAHERQ
jgi:hydroxymethylbilane synthase